MRACGRARRGPILSLSYCSALDHLYRAVLLKVTRSEVDANDAWEGILGHANDEVVS